MNALEPDHNPDSSEGVAPWSQTISGIAFDLLAPTPAMVDFHDIAWSLSHQRRFLGHTVLPCSIASHSIMVRDITVSLARRSGYGIANLNKITLAAILHDAHEAYIGDIISPIMALPGMREIVRPLKARVQAAIHRRVKLPVELPDEWRRLIHQADLIALATEKRDLMVACPRPWLPLPPAEEGMRAGDQITFNAFLAELYSAAYPGSLPAANEPPVFEPGEVTA
ncbi:HD domain-containing protein [Rhodovarius crocodyli]|uniref:HD domain-containing protein n=1 Tax=Rhodovarius crocodyli TaxID=1979269 RepID=A0A437M1G4_9PROT|nr:YfbR-like 5'-deoxynucleotidase [Rhodovarius crocodyli]RVT91442.1 HD domain-containing protein [Rhodovarius crocodyli]